MTGLAGGFIDDVAWLAAFLGVDALTVPAPATDIRRQKLHRPMASGMVGIFVILPAGTEPGQPTAQRLPRPGRVERQRLFHPQDDLSHLLVRTEMEARSSQGAHVLWLVRRRPAVAADLCPLVDGGSGSMMLKHRSVWSDDCHPASAGGLRGISSSWGRHFNRNNIDLDIQRQHQCRLWLMLPGIYFADAIRFSVAGTDQRRKVYLHQGMPEMLQDSIRFGLLWFGLPWYTFSRNFARPNGTTELPLLPVATRTW